jgi:hypothetical protein
MKDFIFVIIKFCSNMFLEQSVMPNMHGDSLGNAGSPRPPVAEGNFHIALFS